MTTTAQTTTTDFAFLTGSWQVDHRRLAAPLTGSDDWSTFTSKSVAWNHLNGGVSIDETAMADQGVSGMSLRLFEPDTQEWTVRWISSRDYVLQPPVRGRWVGLESQLSGSEEYEGRPIEVTYHWDLSGANPQWDQAFSADGGQTWETNWIMNLTQIDRSETDDPSLGVHLPKHTSDFDFLTGTWDVHHERLKERLVGCTEWVELDHVQHARTHFNGSISIDENHMPGLYSGLTFRIFDPVAQEWAIYWIDGRTGQLGEPVRGRFVDGVGEFLGYDEHEGQPILCRFLWTVLSETKALWEQAFSTDDGKTWETNWRLHHTRRNIA